MGRQTIRITLLSLLVLACAIAVFLPDRFWPEDWIPYRAYRGEFTGEPIVFEPPHVNREMLPLKYEIDMDNGVCQIGRVDASGDIENYSAMGKGSISRGSLPRATQFRLDPGGNSGHYKVSIGLEFNPLSPLMRRTLFGGALASLLLLALVRWRKARWLSAIGRFYTRREWLIITAYSVFVGLLVYGAIHELGHALAGLAMGGEVNHITFTMLGGDRPHVDFKSLPEKAWPWSGFGAVFLPILVGYLFIGVWLLTRKRLGRLGQTLLLIPPAYLILPGFAYFFDDHLLTMARKIGLEGAASKAFTGGLPSLLTVVAILIVWRALRKQNSLQIASKQQANNGEA